MIHINFNDRNQNWADAWDGDGFRSRAYFLHIYLVIKYTLYHQIY